MHKTEESYKHLSTSVQYKKVKIKLGSYFSSGVTTRRCNWDRGRKFTEILRIIHSKLENTRPHFMRSILLSSSQILNSSTIVILFTLQQPVVEPVKPNRVARHLRPPVCSVRAVRAQRPRACEHYAQSFSMPAATWRLRQRAWRPALCFCMCVGMFTSSRARALPSTFVYAILFVNVLVPLKDPDANSGASGYCVVITCSGIFVSTDVRKSGSWQEHIIETVSLAFVR